MILKLIYCIVQVQERRFLKSVNYGHKITQKSSLTISYKYFYINLYITKILRLNNNFYS